MVELQSIVGQRATSSQLSAGMMGSINDGAKTVVGNIGGGDAAANCKRCKAKAKRP